MKDSSPTDSYIVVKERTFDNIDSKQLVVSVVLYI